ncbi:biopolymer transporter ExbD [Candidatus Blochmannia ocreatus (nom. nud.)]|uniref:Biopolymer transporter ExbD n=1 Tax=Candidatus Blochmannia ocreatus (nom. nud.) TaxID=251538 RepID=A0ABY4SX73_9ENTR|nr:biopolymer transporter ExbD [Candidatus Blochmannia ocreatus]URJ25396.1 biopolymer transporter ExbD [Candidatus Blochmannia ocreatus]
MRKQNIRNKIKSEINIVPLLDILLVLLIIFMTIPIKLIQKFEVNLPNSDITKNFIKNEKITITIEILNKGLYNLVLDNTKIGPMPLTQLSSEINSQIHSNKTANTLCLIAASRTTTYNEIVVILNLLQINGIHSVGILTNPSH